MLSCSFVLFLTWLLHTTVYFWSVCCVWILCWEHKLMPTTSHRTALCVRAELWRAHTHRVTLLCPLLRMQSCGELTPTASHCTVLCIESCGKLTPTVSHCTVPCVQSCGSAQCSIILRLHQVLASCCFFFFLCSPLPVLKCRAL